MFDGTIQTAQVACRNSESFAYSQRIKKIG
jgi:hypothetical protein